MRRAHIALLLAICGLSCPVGALPDFLHAFFEVISGAMAATCAYDCPSGHYREPNPLFRVSMCVIHTVNYHEGL
jgi:hypothetical protein